jgi:branched-chain amino acid aminotransferase
MVECTGHYYSEDTAYKEASLFNSDSLFTGITLYEVLRIYKGTCLFLEDHIQRLQESVWLSGYLYTVSIPVIHHVISGLIKKNGMPNGNVKIILHFMTEDRPVLYTCFIPHAYPSPVMYKEGVSTDLYKAVRSNPNVKRMHSNLRQRVFEFIQTKNIYEALLVAEDETVTEGSKTNVFLIQGKTIYTPPKDRVLKGITREKVIQLCSKLNFKLIEQPISINSLNEFDAVFLTGTSPKVLPVCKIGSLTYTTSNPVMNALTKAYDDLIAAYIRQ